MIPEPHTLNDLHRWLTYEQYAGETTRHECGCGRDWCRRYACVQCLQEAVDRLKEEQP